MPANFPEIWLDRVIQNLDNSNVATFLNGISEIDADVQQINQGTITEQNKIYVPVSDFEVDVLINNNTYPIEAQAYADGTVELTLDKLQTKVITLSDDQIMGSSYDKIDRITKSGVRAMTTTKYKKAIHAIAPMSDTATTPVIEASGDDDGTGRLRLTYKDLVKLKNACDKAGFNEGQKRLVLCQDHWNDLLLDRDNFGDQLVNYATRKPNPMIASFELHSYPVMPIYDNTGAKKPFGSVKTATDTTASVVFIPEAIGKKTGITKQIEFLIDITL